jgi:serine protease Do
MNHGNSGGPLFNMAGEVIGINNQILSGSREGGSIGLGFAIPTDDLKFLLQQIHAYGHPRLGTIGMAFQEVTFDMSDALGVSEGGAIVTEITPGSPAALAGIKAGDIVKSYDNQKVANYRALARAITESVGKTITLNVWSAGTIKTASVQVQELPQENLWVDYKSNSVPQPVFRQISDFGMDMKEITSDLRKQYGISSEISGPVVTNVITESAAYNAHLQAGDVVLKVQLSDVATLAEFANSLTELRDRGNRSVLVLVIGSQGKRWTTLPLRL